MPYVFYGIFKVRSRIHAANRWETMRRPRSALAVIHERLIVDVWSNERAQNDMRNAIDDYFYDVFRDEMGVELNEGQMDDLLARIMRLAQARFPQE